MKKIISLIFLFSFAVILTSCGPKQGGLVEGESFVDGRWVDDDTFRMTGAGVPKAGLTNKIQQRKTAQQAAIIDAQARIIEKFKGARLAGAAGMSDYASSGVAVTKEFEGMVRGGSVVKSTYDKDNNCEVIYEISRKGLKKQVMGGVE